MIEYAEIPWDDWIRTPVLNPAGMTEALTDLSGFRDNPQRATGYYPGDAGRIAIPLRDTNPVAPAGGVYAHLDDRLRYTQLLANGGTIA